jgi:hypothetical protein
MTRREQNPRNVSLVVDPLSFFLTHYLKALGGTVLASVPNKSRELTNRSTSQHRPARGWRSHV